MCESRSFDDVMQHTTTNNNNNNNNNNDNNNNNNIIYMYVLSIHNTRHSYNCTILLNPWGK